MISMSNNILNLCSSKYNNCTFFINIIKVVRSYTQTLCIIYNVRIHYEKLNELEQQQTILILSLSTMYSKPLEVDKGTPYVYSSLQGHISIIWKLIIKIYVYSSIGIFVLHRLVA